MSPVAFKNYIRDKKSYNYALEAVFSECQKAVHAARVSENEENCRNLWKQYFEVMATKERVNPKLQRAFVPVRYRKHLPEFEIK